MSRLRWSLHPLWLVRKNFVKIGDLWVKITFLKMKRNFLLKNKDASLTTRSCCLDTFKDHPKQSNIDVYCSRIRGLHY